LKNQKKLGLRTIERNHYKNIKRVHKLNKKLKRLNERYNRRVERRNRIQIAKHKRNLRKFKLRCKRSHKKHWRKCFEKLRLHCRFGLKYRLHKLKNLKENIYI